MNSEKDNKQNSQKDNQNNKQNEKENNKKNKQSKEGSVALSLFKFQHYN